MSVQRLRIDTNVLLRFLRADHETHSPAAKSLFDAASAGRCEIVLDPIIIAESVWVLASFYKAGRSKIAHALTGLLGQPGILCDDRGPVLDALERYAAKNIDFIDCYLAAHAALGGEPIVSFDSDFRKFADIVVLQPGAAAKR